MPGIVIDASALGAIVYDEPEGEAIALRVNRRQPIAPALIWFEMASICLKKIKKHPDQSERLLAAFRDAPQMGVQVREVTLVDVVPLARQTGLSAYDASYLWLARHLKAELVTLDQELDEAWKGVSEAPDSIHTDTEASEPGER